MKGYYIIENDLFYKGKKITPDENNIAVLLIDGKEKRFVLTKFIEWLKVKKIVPNKTKRKQKNYYKKLGTLGVHRRRAIIAIDSKGIEYKFESATKAAKELKISRSNIPRALNNFSKKAGQYHFKYDL